MLVKLGIGWRRMVPDYFWKHKHSEGANSIFNWLFMARRLVHAAIILDAQSDKLDPKQAANYNPYKDVTNVSCMCMGMAIECYLKAYYLATDNLLHDGKKLKRFGSSHKLDKLAKEVGFSLTSDQEKVMRYLSMYVIAKGRYPVPLYLDDMKLDPSDVTEFEQYGIKWDEASYEICYDVVKALELAIKTARSK